MTQAEHIIEKFGGIRPMARKIGLKWHNNVQQWKDYGYIPARWHQQILESAEREGIDLTPNDFFASPGVNGEGS
nr:hypothetical protein 26 [bacterium]